MFATLPTMRFSLSHRMWGFPIINTSVRRDFSIPSFRQSNTRAWNPYILDYLFMYVHNNLGGRRQGRCGSRMTTFSAFLYCVRCLTGCKLCLRNVHGKHCILLGVDPSTNKDFAKPHCQHRSIPMVLTRFINHYTLIYYWTNMAKKEIPTDLWTDILTMWYLSNGYVQLFPLKFVGHGLECCTLCKWTDWRKEYGMLT